MDWKEKMKKAITMMAEACREANFCDCQRECPFFDICTDHFEVGTLPEDWDDILNNKED